MREGVRIVGPMLDLAWPLLIGLMGSLHCLGMCGPIVVACSLQRSKGRGDSGDKPAYSVWPGVLQHVTFHWGRLMVYGLMGALAAVFFRLADPGIFIQALRGSMSLLGGLLLLLLGLVLLRWVPLPSFLEGVSLGTGSLLGRWMRSVIGSQGIGGRVALGIAAGFMPCCLSLAMLVTAGTTQDPVQGFATMVAFGLGTIPVLLVAGFSASWISIRVRIIGEKVAALSVMAMGLMLVFHGTRSLL